MARAAARLVADRAGAAGRLYRGVGALQPGGACRVDAGARRGGGVRLRQPGHSDRCLADRELRTAPAGRGAGRLCLGLSGGDAGLGRGRHRPFGADRLERGDAAGGGAGADRPAGDDSGARTGRGAAKRAGGVRRAFRGFGAGAVRGIPVAAGRGGGDRLHRRLPPRRGFGERHARPVLHVARLQPGGDRGGERPGLLGGDAGGRGFGRGFGGAVGRRPGPAGYMPCSRPWLC